MLFGKCECILYKLCYKIATETLIREMYENAKPCLVSKMARLFVRNERPPKVLILKMKEIIIFVDIVMLKKILGMYFFIDICTRHRRVPNMLILIFVPTLSVSYWP